MNSIVLDSGPLIALFDASDKHHKHALNFIKNNKTSLYTTTAVLTEVTFMLDFNLNAQADFLEWVYKGGPDIINLNKNDLFKIKELMIKYKDLPMDFTDGTIIVSCEKLESNKIASIDSDFQIYRYQGKKKFKNMFM